MGTRRGSSLKDFAAVHGRSAGTVVELEGQEFGNLILTVPKPRENRDRIAAAADPD